ncbi:hypothetical protein FHG87_023642, partial [Trinorchestia longiramus]
DGYLSFSRFCKGLQICLLRSKSGNPGLTPTSLASSAQSSPSSGGVSSVVPPSSGGVSRHTHRLKLKYPLDNNTTLTNSQEFRTSCANSKNLQPQALTISQTTTSST